MGAALAIAALVPQASVAQDWGGFYGGLSLSAGSGDYQDFNSGVPDFTDDFGGSLVGVLAGYSFQNGAWVYGGELAFSDGELEYSSGPDAWTERVIDLKARVGYAAGQALIYGVLAMSSADIHFRGPVTNNPVRSDGLGLGLGVDFMEADRTFVGVEYMRRDLEIDAGEIGGFPTYSVDHEVNTLSLRAGMRF